MPLKTSQRKRRVCFVSGTRAEFGLMASTLRAIRNHPKLSLQIILTGSHLDRSRGQSRNHVERDGWKVDRVVPWKATSNAPQLAAATGRAMQGIASAFGEVRPDIVLVVGDRVEAFAAASAAHIGGLIVAHVHGGDRALGQIDDSLRHAVTKLAHIHFPATASSARRIVRLGEDRRRVFHVGSPGNDGIAKAAASIEKARAFLGGCKPHQYALIVLHPVSPDALIELRRATMVLHAVRIAALPAIVIYPNTDPGADGIVSAWEKNADKIAALHRTVPRDIFLTLMRDAAVLVGNSSSGIIEAASLGTPVVDIGPRQEGRERDRHVVNVLYSLPAIASAVRTAAMNKSRGITGRLRNKSVYSGNGAGEKIARTLAKLTIDDKLHSKLITY